MHEAGIAQSILGAALAARPKGSSRITKMMVTAGWLSSVEQESLSMYLTELSRGTPAEGAKLELKITPARLVCRTCGASREYDGAGPVEAACPKCGGPYQLKGDHHDHDIVLDGLEVQTEDH